MRQGRRDLRLLALVPHEVHVPHLPDQHRLVLGPPAHDRRELLNARAPILDGDNGPVAHQSIVYPEKLSAPPDGFAERMVSDPAELHHGKHRKRLERAGTLHCVFPELEGRDVFPGHRTPGSRIAGAELRVELVGVLEVDLRVVKAWVVEIGELEDEALHELGARVGDEVAIVVARAGDHAALEAPLEGLLGEGVQKRLVDRVPAQDVRVFGHQLVDDGAEVRRFDGEQVLGNEIPSRHLERGPIGRD